MRNSKVSLREAILVLVIALAIMGTGVIGLGLSPQVPVLLAITVTIFWAKITGFSWDEINAGIKDGIDKGIIPIVIFILIGAMISTWIAAGTIPTLMVIGFKAISAQWFLPTVFLVCSLVGAAVGSCFTVVSTVGIAFFGIGVTMSFNPALVAGAIISGGIFGDKCSPLSETNNLAAAVVDTDLFDHMKTILWSTVPAATISTIAFAVLGMGHNHADMNKINTTVAALNSDFHISIVALIPIVLVFICAAFKMAAIPTMLLNIFVSTAMMFVNNAGLTITKASTIITNGFVAKTSNNEVNLLLSRGGIVSMMPTVALIVLTLSLGGLLVHFGLISAIMSPLATHLNNSAKLITAALGACIGVNIFIGEQFLSIILPGRAFKKTFNNDGLASRALGRVLEDGGTVLNYLVPWGVGGVFIANTLGVPTIQYLPFVFFSLLCPIFSLLSGFTGVGLKKLESNQSVKNAKPATNEN
ncbi:Na+/H+ antiporter NhaC [Lentilactobacillus kefiri]|uniref:Na+ H+ antiporter NhaC n=2 Tax=Lentilactobacillus kefiri TaxID=33962 RepID=A0A8E1V2Q4_LENKE|nr:Na+/H+ antiporter NhaC [Lentilactobacillus kefiri]KRL75473.1 Na+ H+ antiporter NhaC [Lentilactobacillus parakefiri DSM 10551]KRM53637.1 Na+ H+ antiporter NhaC [Lentilactobacillus kefiri DSM 20587 = JCM 5818]MCJ2161107.1 Na+/H+ antiporter NhaC [Lentilactobacillus kefiri]MCP9369660.1 Na+/H+ antiporter NhaC [Lentilactobacillus kefiri]MDH5109211.1 Na+/H+ antiporter NhaC [Lentilactobacillus kefiri]